MLRRKGGVNAKSTFSPFSSRNGGESLRENAFLINLKCVW